MLASLSLYLRATYRPVLGALLLGMAGCQSEARIEDFSMRSVGRLCVDKVTYLRVAAPYSSFTLVVQLDTLGKVVRCVH